jgi:hypothetical protein
VEVSPFPFSEVSELREKYTYNITPWSQGLAVAKRGLKILYRLILLLTNYLQVNPSSHLWNNASQDHSLAFL